MLIGNQVLREFAMTLDQRSKAIRLARSDATIPAPPPRRTLGFMTRPSDSGERIVRLVDQSPASKLLKIGDVVLELNGKNFDSSRIESLREAANRGPVHLKVRREGAQVEVDVDPMVLVP
jgi:S1-C subfamily serine protease